MPDLNAVCLSVEWRKALMKQVHLANLSSGKVRLAPTVADEKWYTSIFKTDYNN